MEHPCKARPARRAHPNGIDSGELGTNHVKMPTMRTSARIRLCAVVGIALSVTGPGALSAQPASSDAQKRADALFSQGQRFLKNKEYAVACAAFEQSHKLDPAIGTQLNLALCYEQWGHLAAAYQAFVDAAQMADVANDDRGPKALVRAQDLKPKLATLSLTISDDGLPAEKPDPAAVIVLDGKGLNKRAMRNMLVDAGPHQLEVRAPGREPVTKRFALIMGQREEFELDIPAPLQRHENVRGAHSTTRLAVGWTLTGLGVVGAGAAGYLALAARGDYRAEFASNCNSATNACNEAGYLATHDARGRANIASLVAGGGLALAVTGVVVLLTGRTSKVATGSAWYVVPQVGRDGGAMALGGSF